MQLLLRRDQHPGLLGKTVFTLDVRANLTPEERANITKYKLGSTLLYEKKPLKQGGNGYSQLGQAILWRTLNILISVGDLERGRRVDCKDIMEMLAVEGQIREAAQNFKQVLDAASKFGGEEVVEL